MHRVRVLVAHIKPLQLYLVFPILYTLTAIVSQLICSVCSSSELAVAREATAYMYTNLVHILKAHTLTYTLLYTWKHIMHMCNTYIHTPHRLTPIHNVLVFQWTWSMRNAISLSNTSPIHLTDPGQLWQLKGWLSQCLLIQRPPHIQEWMCLAMGDNFLMFFSISPSDYYLNQKWWQVPRSKEDKEGIFHSFHSSAEGMNVCTIGRLGETWGLAIASKCNVAIDRYKVASWLVIAGYHLHGCLQWRLSVFPTGNRAGLHCMQSWRPQILWFSCLQNAWAHNAALKCSQCGMQETAIWRLHLQEL